uniref:Uncharacterized protein n=1 Tax=Daphnia galeata TaxID=27404 RepID=A0A8J2RR25_9CRUS|nr:unnamed protein product [Daphnia galeata]
MACLNDKFVTLAEGIKEPSCNVYAVVNCVVQEPKLTRRKTHHGICILIDHSCYEGSVKREEFCIQIFTPSKSCAVMIENGDILLLRGITKQQCLKNPEKSEFLFRSDNENVMVVFQKGQKDVVRVGSGIGPVPQDITLENQRFVESLNNWHRHIKMVPFPGPAPVKSPARPPTNWPLKLKQQLAELDLYSLSLRPEQQSQASCLLAEATARIRKLINIEKTPKRQK